MSKDLSIELDAVMEHYRPFSDNPNSSVSRKGHNCDLPVWVGFPVSIDPRTKRRASTDLVIHCTTCHAIWGVRNDLRAINGPDLVWFEHRFLTRMARLRLSAEAVQYDAATFYLKPDPKTIDWSKEPPLKPNGMRWHQFEFPEMLGHGLDQCVETQRFGFGKIDEEPTWITNRCVLKVAHQGLHESPDPDTGSVAWGSRLAA